MQLVAVFAQSPGFRLGSSQIGGSDEWIATFHGTKEECEAWLVSKRLEQSQLRAQEDLCLGDEIQLNTNYRIGPAKVVSI